MNIDDAMEAAAEFEVEMKVRPHWTLFSESVAVVLAAEVERLRAEVQRLDIAGIHSCHDDCQKLPCVQRREIDRLRAEVESVMRLGPHPVEQVEMPLDVFVKTRFVPAWEYNELADKVHRLEAELAAAKAASVCPVKVLNIWEGTYQSDRYIELRTDAEADTFTDWLRERMKDKSPPEA